MMDGEHEYNAILMDKDFWQYFAEKISLEAQNETGEIAAGFAAPYVRDNHLYVINEEVPKVVLVKYDLDDNPPMRKSIDDMFNENM